MPLPQIYGNKSEDIANFKNSGIPLNGRIIGSAVEPNYAALSNQI
jgi:hypothetical protein